MWNSLISRIVVNDLLVSMYDKRRGAISAWYMCPLPVVIFRIVHFLFFEKCILGKIPALLTLPIMYRFGDDLKKINKT